MKKALVLGVMALFAISIANVNAQDKNSKPAKVKPTTEAKPAVKQEPKIANETPAAKQDINENAPQGKTTQPAAASKTTQNNGKKVAKPAALKEIEKKSTTTSTTVGEAPSARSTSTEKPQGNATATKKGVLNNSVPPTPAKKQVKTTAEPQPIK